MNQVVLNQERMESLKILLFEVISQKHAMGKLTLLTDVLQRLPGGLTDEEFEAVVNEISEAGYADFEPGPGVRSRFRPGARFSMWKNEFQATASNIQNHINVENMINSQIQQSTQNSTQTFSLSIDQNIKFEELVAKLKEEVADISLSQEDRNDLDLTVRTLENQAKSNKKNKGVISASIETITTLLTGAAGSGLWAILAELSKFI